MGFWHLYEKIQLIWDNNAYHEILSESPTQLMSKMLALPPMNWLRQVVGYGTVCTVPICQGSKNKINLTIICQ